VIAFTHHAVERYRERYAPEMSTRQARAALEEAAAGGDVVTLRERTILGDEQRSIPSLGIILVVKRDAGSTDEVAVTVLPAHGPRRAPVDAAIHERAAEVRARLEELRAKRATAEIAVKAAGALPGLHVADRNRKQAAIAGAKATSNVFAKMIQLLEHEARIVAPMAKAIMHEATMGNTASQAKAVARIAIRALVAIRQAATDATDRDASWSLDGIEGAITEAMDEIASLSPGMLTPTFYNWRDPKDPT
jgi:hypothetical protein